MTAPSTIKQRFLSKPNQLGVVAVGFNGGQVRIPAARRCSVDHLCIAVHYSLAQGHLSP
jgi:hypothetical protein